jgi:O-succinylbenzoic acid--CoA ligase
MIALSKNAFLASAEAVNLHLQSDSRDIWLNSLPTFHVGGLSIFARAYLSQAQVFSLENNWRADVFCQLLSEKKITLSSLVPTQVFDLVENKLKAPQSLRAIIVGGGALAPDLYGKALDLGWPILPSFGMTECCSQIATAEILSLNAKNPRLKILSHMQAETTAEGKLKIKSPSLLTGFAQWNDSIPEWKDPKKQDWFLTEDQVILKNGYLESQGRGHQYIKILGEGISLFRLQEIFEQVVRSEDPQNWMSYALTAVPHPRKENEILMLHASANPDKIEKVFRAYNAQVLSIEKLERTFALKEIPRTDLGKVRYELLNQDLKKLL